MARNFYKAFLIPVLLFGSFLISIAQTCNVIYVTPNGASSGSAGTRANPASLTYALTLATGPSNIIWMAAGNYPISTPVQLVSNVTIEGGFDPVTWVKSNATPTVIQKDATNMIPVYNALVGVVGGNLTNLRLQDLTITVPDATQASESVYGLYLNGCSNYNVVRCIITTGNASAGAAGAPGSAGAAGSPGGIGAAGAAEPNPTTSGAGGIGGFTGGAGGVANSYNPGAGGNGAVGSGPNGGSGGNGGSGPGCVLGCFTGPPGCGSSVAGTAGGAGGAGIAGATGGTGPAGTVTAPGYYVVGTTGFTGTAGANGSGGGGGGQGGGQQENGPDDHGGTGGGGGGGGFGGNGGTGGGGGGGSFAVFLYADAGGGNFVDCNLTAGLGGAGGVGGAGGAGGAGGGGGTGGGLNPVCGSSNTVGGAGGAGGSGGNGGGGGDGAAGPSINLATNGATVTQNNITSVPGNPPVISVQNTGCTNAQIMFSAPISGAWNFGAGATPATGNGTGPIAVNYSSVGRKTITYSGTTFTDFVGIFNAQSVSNTITQSASPPINGCPDTFRTTIPASFYVWDFGPMAIPPVDSGPAGTAFSTVFLAPGTYTVSVYANTPCCGIVKDSITFTVQPNTLNISLSYTPDSICYGSSMTFVASPANYQSYSFYINDSLIQSTSKDTFTTNALKPGDSVLVLGFQGVCYTNPSATIYPYIIPIPPAPVLTNSVPNDTICGGDTVTFTATPGYAVYIFSAGSSQQQTSPSNVWTTSALGQGQSISVKASYNGICFSPTSNRDTVIIKQTPVALLSALSTNICQGNSDVLTTNITPGATYQFYINGISVQDSTINTYTSANFNNGDTVYVAATLNGCTSHAATNPGAYIGLTVRPTPTVTLTSSAAPGDSICQGLPITFTATPATDTAYLFFNGSNLIQDGPASTYTTTTLANNSSISVLVINSAGCPSIPSDTITTTVVPDPVVTVGTNPAPVCISAPAQTLTGFSPTGGIWTGPGTTQAGVVTPASAGTGSHQLVYTYIDPNSGCPGSDSVLFTVNPLPVIAVAPASPSICIGQSVQLLASGGTSYVWTPSAGLSNTTIANPVANPIATTAYQLNVTDANNCTDSTSVTVTVALNPSASFTATTVCANTPTVFTNNSTPAVGNTYSWYFGDGTTSSLPDPSHSYTTSDSFAVSLIAQLGSCYDTATNPVLVFPAVVANFTTNTLVSYNDTLDPVVFIDQSTNANVWAWDFGDMVTSNTESPSHVYNTPGVYSITLVAANQFGCMDSIVRQNYISIYPMPVLFVPNVFTPGQSANSILKVFTSGVVFFDWAIFDRWGEKVYQSNNVNDGWDGTYSGKPSAAGVYTYYLKVVFSDGSTRHYHGGVTLLK